MTLASNILFFGPFIKASRIDSYFAVASAVGLIYDWALTFGQEVELIWKKRWSLMTAMYLSVRYVGLIYSIIRVLLFIPVTTAVSPGGYLALDWMCVVTNAILGVIMIARLYAMYQKSRNVLTFLVVVFLAVNIANGVLAGIIMKDVSGEIVVLSGMYQCIVSFGGDSVFLGSVTWIFAAVWELVTLCLAVWITAKHFRELRRSSAGGIIGDCFTVLIKTHVLYFASFVPIACFNLAYLSPITQVEPYSMKRHIYVGFLQIFSLAGKFVLGPRLIIGVREYHARLVTDSDAATSVTSIVFEKHVYDGKCSV
ncbi:uncharacterized protein EDB93DRAFT_362038 [Suillus bovinus]|uniref:uncharacterized protein n=1 Tax=Suillus bovinus TaxID=48563 RepID=UPI001B871609|nr:uncharacterized protein EDB93DRAFT_362038 [Suillus bovinus]KAG2149122.1 hypothetical protein EDB93DRAFT_362038 [Suillus bovinus]